MKIEKKLKHAVILGILSTTALKAAEKTETISNQNDISLKSNETLVTKKHVNKMVTIQGVETWVTDDESINDLDLEPIKYKLITEDNVTGLTLKQVDVIGEKYRAFLYLSKKYPDNNIVPNKEVDMFWHAHILDTYKYQEDCQKIFGQFFHHYPYFGMKDKNDEINLENSFNETLDLYKKEFPSKISSKMIDRGALCIGEGQRTMKALCIGEGQRAIKAFNHKEMGQLVKEVRVERNDGAFENRDRPRFDRVTGEVIFK